MTQLSSSSLKRLISILKDINAIKFGNFLLKDGTVSKVYIDLRILPNFPKEYQEVTKIIANYIRIDTDINPFDGIIAPPLAGIPLGVALAIELNKEYYLARLKPKTHGTMKLIEGNISNKRILIVDDVFTTGETKVPILRAIRHHGGKVNSFFVVVNRVHKEEKVTQFEEFNQVKIHYLLSMEDII
ncbi:MAG: orotate phosphoribosyltransferase [Candidatus Hodarchaeota archaeon]